MYCRHGRRMVTRRRFLSDERGRGDPCPESDICARAGRPAPAPPPPPARPMRRCCLRSFPPSVAVTLPGGARPSFALALEELGEGFARAGIIKDAGDDPDVTHGALVIARVSHGPPGSGVTFRAGEGVGTVTRAGLPLPPGEPAINPVPRRMIKAAIDEAARALWRDGRRDRRDFDSGRRRHRQANAQREARDRWRPFDPGHDGDRRAVFLRRMDRYDPSRDRCRPRGRPRSCRGLDRLGFGSGDQGLAWIAGHRTDRDGRFRRRHAEISCARTQSPK